MIDKSSLSPDTTTNEDGHCSDTRFKVLRERDQPVSQAMQWFFLGLITLWIMAAMIMPVVSFSITKNPLSFSLFSTLAPPLYILYRITKYLFPKNSREYELAALKIQNKKPIISINIPTRSQIQPDAVMSHHEQLRRAKSAYSE